MKVAYISPKTVVIGLTHFERADLDKELALRELSKSKPNYQLIDRLTADGLKEVAESKKEEFLW